MYVLCGDPRASVSQVTGIQPIDLNKIDQSQFLLDKVRSQLRNGIACIYLEGGSGASQAIPVEIVAQVRQLINELSPQTLLFIGGGISKQEQVHTIASYADCIIVGTYLESQTPEQFRDAVRDLQSGL